VAHAFQTAKKVNYNTMAHTVHSLAKQPLSNNFSCFIILLLSKGEQGQGFLPTYAPVEKPTLV